MNVVEIPLLAGNQVFDIQLGGIAYRMVYSIGALLVGY
ncbi:hypothetical protein SAMN05421579_11470 [Xenorhabdus japonica]|uniref:Uncharacterized protein n=1 Tax=Xenorhabdus japonica TaxID=53341 RepID=A0A1I5AXK5_9GAMM|nr:hypothetical protein SAMN05421579_11470 [Xenorhabdus japonica]